MRLRNHRSSTLNIFRVLPSSCWWQCSDIMLHIGSFRILNEINSAYMTWHTWLDHLDADIFHHEALFKSDHKSNKLALKCIFCKIEFNWQLSWVIQLIHLLALFSTLPPISTAGIKMSLKWTQPLETNYFWQYFKKKRQWANQSQLRNTRTSRVKVGTHNSKAPICGACELWMKMMGVTEQIQMNMTCFMPHLVPPKSMIRSPTMQQHCRLRGQGPFPFGSTFVQEAFSAMCQ